MIESINIYICKCGSAFRDDDTSCPGCGKPTKGMTIFGGYKVSEGTLKDVIEKSHDYYKKPEK